MRRLLGTITPNNTNAWDEPESAGCRLHSTCVLYIDKAKGTVRLNSGGWETVTTKRRINEAFEAFGLPFRVWAKDYEWFVHRLPIGESDPVPFLDGMTFPIEC